mmetsp:Transcript_73319/g.206476  ORF Transcript_73319/g.206476 Transcript_73319/m.206476 type:complete len:208 (-) Transcript_73319:565-1188(-)
MNVHASHCHCEPSSAPSVDLGATWDPASEAANRSCIQRSGDRPLLMPNGDGLRRSARPGLTELRSSGRRPRLRLRLTTLRRLRLRRGPSAGAGDPPRRRPPLRERLFDRLRRALRERLRGCDENRLLRRLRFDCDWLARGEAEPLRAELSTMNAPCVVMPKIPSPTKSRISTMGTYAHWSSILQDPVVSEPGNMSAVNKPRARELSV